MLILVPALTFAQTPPIPPAPPAPVAPPVPPAPPAPPAPPTPVMMHYDRMAADEARHAAEMVRIDSEIIREQARAAAEQARFAYNWDFQQGAGANSFMTYSGQQSNEGSSYNNALSLMNERKFDEAVNRFDRVIMQ